MLKCILDTNRTGKQALKHKSATRRSPSVTDKGTRKASSIIKGQKRASPLTRGRASQNRVSRDSKTTVKGKDNLQNASRKPSRAGKQTSTTPEQTRAAEGKRNRSIGSAEFSRPGPTLGKKTDSPKKQKRNSTSSAAKPHDLTKENIKQETQPEIESLKRTNQADNGENSGSNWLPNPVYSSREGESNDARTDRSEYSLPWVTMTSFTGRTVSDPNQPISKQILETVKETTTRAKMQIKAHPIRTEQTPEAAKTTDQSINIRRVPNRASFDQLPLPNAGNRVLSATDLAIRNTIERKLGKPLSEVDPASLKVISEERMKELMSKYGAGCQPPSGSLAAQILYNKKHQLRHSTDGSYSSASQTSPQRER